MPSRRQVGGSQSTLRRAVGHRVFGRLFCRVPVSCRGLLRRQRFTQNIIEHFGARLRPVTQRSCYFRADAASVGLAGAEPAQVADGRRGSGNGLRCADIVSGSVPLAAAAAWPAETADVAEPL